ncbi:MAG TPA: hypothetical protein VK037_04510 [Pseudogracilibacillus sp.]|nr:hypothetical protein [Pseudogracilibacillus sp.]
MKIKRATDVKRSDFEVFLKRNDTEIDEAQFQQPTSYVIEEHGTIISWFQIESLHHRRLWLKKMLIVQEEAMKLPNVLQSILQFANERQVQKLYVNSKQLVTDLLFSSFSFTLQTREELEPFQLTKEGNWWYYSFVEERITEMAFLK